MGKSKFLHRTLLLAITAGTITMNAQKTNNEALSAQQQSLVSLSALTATGNTDALKTALNTGLDAGLTIIEIKELLVQLYAYCGFPRSLNGINTFKNVLDERRAKGINDKTGNEIIANNNVADKYEQGRKVLETLSKTPQPKPAPGFGEFAPRIDTFLKEHLFADVFASGVLTYQQRELVTIAALASMPGVEAQLKSHMGIGKNTGLTDGQLLQLAGLIEKNISITQANTVRRVLAQPETPVIAPDMVVRISEIEIVPEFLDEYKATLIEEASASVKIEPGVIAIFPMYDEQNPARIRILEIYADKAAYEAHLMTPHFLHYKSATQKMVKSLRLVDMDSMDIEAMPAIFKKLK